MISNFDDYLKKYKESVEFPEKFWSSYAENFKWKKKWDEIFTCELQAKNWKDLYEIISKNFILERKNV